MERQQACGIAIVSQRVKCSFSWHNLPVVEKRSSGHLSSGKGRSAIKAIRACRRPSSISLYEPFMENRIFYKENKTSIASYFSWKLGQIAQIWREEGGQWLTDMQLGRLAEIYIMTSLWSEESAGDWWNFTLLSKSPVPCLKRTIIHTEKELHCRE